MAKKFLKGTIIGAAIGAVAGLLFAPKSGKETRADIKRKAKATGDRAQAKYGDIKKTVSEKATDVKEAGQELANETKQRGRGLWRRSKRLGQEAKQDAKALKRSVKKQGRKLK